MTALRQSSIPMIPVIPWMKSPPLPRSCTLSLSLLHAHPHPLQRPVRRFSGHVFVHIAQDGVLESIARNGAWLSVCSTSAGT